MRKRHQLTMPQLARHLLLLLIAITLPLQGLAAVTMGVCHPAPVETATTAAMDHGHCQMHAQMHHDHHTMADHGSHQQHPTDTHDTPHKATCAACHAFSIPVNFQLTTPTALPTAPITASAPALMGTDPESPERPPKHRLA